MKIPWCFFLILTCLMYGLRHITQFYPVLKIKDPGTNLKNYGNHIDHSNCSSIVYVDCIIVYPSIMNNTESWSFPTRYQICTEPVGRTETGRMTQTRWYSSCSPYWTKMERWEINKYMRGSVSLIGSLWLPYLFFSTKLALLKLYQGISTPCK